MPQEQDQIESPGEGEGSTGTAVTTPSGVVAAPEVRAETVAVEAAPAVTVAPEVLAESLSDYLGAWARRIRSGESGALPIILGLIVIVLFFQVENSHFLTAGNIVNLLNQAAFFVLLGMAEVFALLLGEIDLSVGYVAAVGGSVTAALVGFPIYWPWWAAVIVGLLASAAIGALQGTLITRLRLPSFVVTLAGLLGWAGVLIWIFDLDSKGSVGGVITITNPVIYDLVNGQLTPTVAWVVLIALVALFAVLTLTRTARRRGQGLSAPPLSITVATIAVVAVASVALVFVCNLNRGSSIAVLQGVPWVVLFVVAVIAGWTVLLGRTRTGRYIYAIGASPEAARRAGVNVAGIRTVAFTLAGFTAGLAGIVYESRLGSISVGFDGGTYVLYAVAAAVIGGTSLMGGRGKAIHPLLGGLVIAAVTNGLSLLNISTAGTEMATALVLLVAVTVDAVVRRRSSTAR